MSSDAEGDSAITGEEVGGTVVGRDLEKEGPRRGERVLLTRGEGCVHGAEASALHQGALRSAEREACAQLPAPLQSGPFLLSLAPAAGEALEPAQKLALLWGGPPARSKEWDGSLDGMSVSFPGLTLEELPVRVGPPGRPPS